MYKLKGGILHLYLAEVYMWAAARALVAADPRWAIVSVGMTEAFAVVPAAAASAGAAAGDLASFLREVSATTGKQLKAILEAGLVASATTAPAAAAAAAAAAEP